jgi:hypothetical protein
MTYQTTPILAPKTQCRPTLNAATQLGGVCGRVGGWVGGGGGGAAERARSPSAPLRTAAANLLQMRRAAVATSTAQPRCAVDAIATLDTVLKRRAIGGARDLNTRRVAHGVLVHSVVPKGDGFGLSRALLGAAGSTKKHDHKRTAHALNRPRLEWTYTPSTFQAHTSGQYTVEFPHSWAVGDVEPAGQ